MFAAICCTSAAGKYGRTSAAAEAATRGAHADEPRRSEKETGHRKGRRVVHVAYLSGVTFRSINRRVERRGKRKKEKKSMLADRNIVGAFSNERNSTNRFCRPFSYRARNYKQSAGARGNCVVSRPSFATLRSRCSFPFFLEYLACFNPRRLGRPSTKCPQPGELNCPTPGCSGGAERRVRGDRSAEIERGREKKAAYRVHVATVIIEANAGNDTTSK